MFIMQTRNRKIHRVLEITARDLKAAKASAASNDAFHPITANYARKLVKDGYARATVYSRV